LELYVSRNTGGFSSFTTLLVWIAGIVDWMNLKGDYQGFIQPFVTILETAYCANLSGKKLLYLTAAEATCHVFTAFLSVLVVDSLWK
jgi:hypothetical protein